jgi:hypothetical protein
MGNYFVEYGIYSRADDDFVYDKKECDTFEECMSYVRYKFNTSVATSFNQITYVNGDEKYDWEYLKNKYCDKYQIQNFREGIEYSVQPAAIP